ncbi:MAG: hypothetical protein ACOX3G_12735 [Armatimonadota bacterium]|jgi:hypothetical protein
MNYVKMMMLILGGAVVLGIADYVAPQTAAAPQDIQWLMMFHEVIFVGAFGVAAGRLLTSKWWFLVAISPVLYYGHLCILMQTPMFLWLDSRMILSIISVMTAAYVGAATKIKNT